MDQNPLYSLFNKNTPLMGQNGFMAQLEAFKKQFNGDPKAQIQRMLDTGQITQEQYNRAVQIAKTITGCTR